MVVLLPHFRDFCLYDFKGIFMSGAVEQIARSSQVQLPVRLRVCSHVLTVPVWLFWCIISVFAASDFNFRKKLYAKKAFEK